MATQFFKLENNKHICSMFRSYYKDYRYKKLAKGRGVCVCVCVCVLSLVPAKDMEKLEPLCTVDGNVK